MVGELFAKIKLPLHGIINRISQNAWTLLILVAVSFGMLWLGDKLDARGMVLTRFMARAQAPLTAQFNYPDTSRNQITVVMYDQEFLQSSASAWPISYQDHADALLRLVADPGARPKAIMLDITFGQERDDPTLAALKKTLCTIQNDYKVPIFLAALPSAKEGRLAIRAGLGPDHSGAGPACFTLVGVDYVPDPLDGLAWSYQLSRHLTSTGWQPGTPDSPQHQQPTYRSAAMTIAQDVARIDLGEETTPMALMWGHNSAHQTDRPESLQHCRPGMPDLWQLIPGVLRQIWEPASLSPLCPYHQTLSMAQLGVMSEGELAPYLGGRYIMVGAHVPGYNDFADSPVQGIVPGVYMHAMALDNLLTYKGDYKLNAEWTLPPSLPLLAPGLLTITVVFVVHLFWIFCQTKLRFLIVAREGLAARINWYLHCPLPATRTQRVVQSGGTALGWLARISIQTVAVMLLIGLLQNHFRVGMLPVVELVSMTLLAEGLGYMKKIKFILFGDKEQSEKICNRLSQSTLSHKKGTHEIQPDSA